MTNYTLNGNVKVNGKEYLTFENERVTCEPCEVISYVLRELYKQSDNSVRLKIKEDLHIYISEYPNFKDMINFYGPINIIGAILQGTVLFKEEFEKTYFNLYLPNNVCISGSIYKESRDF